MKDGLPSSLQLRLILQRLKGGPGRKELFFVLYCSLGSLLLFTLSYQLITFSGLDLHIYTLLGVCWWHNRG